MLLAIFALAVPFSTTSVVANIVIIILAFFQKRFLILIFILLAVQVFISTDLRIINELSTPLGKYYTTDMRAFLKTYQLMKEGQNFYPAFVTGMGGLRDGYFHPDVNAWRQPFVFYLWKVLPGNGASIYFLWQVMLIFVLVAAYLVTRNILSPLILWPYLHYSLVDLTLLQPEWWGMAFFVFGLAGFANKKDLLTGIFFALALACREPFIIPIIFLAIYRRNPRLFLPLLIFVFYFLFFHIPTIFQFGTEWLRSYSHGNIRTLHSILAYSSWNYLIGVYRPFLILFFLSLIFLFFRRKNSILILSFLPFFLFTAFMAYFGKIDSTRDYWSIYFIPGLLISAPALILPSGK